MDSVNVNDNTQLVHDNKKETDGEIYLDDGHALDAFRKMSEMREQKLFCDVCLAVENKEIHAHKMVLASCSDYFERMFTDSYKEGSQKTITLEDIDSETVIALINYMYTSKIRITEDNVEDLLFASRMWFLNSVVVECCTFLEKRLNAQNCLNFWDTAISIGNTEMKTKAEEYIDEHFEIIVSSEQFLRLKLQQLIEIISRNTLSTTSEEVVCDAAISWINYDIKERTQHFGKLMKYIRIPLLSKEYVKSHIMGEQIIKTDVVCKDEIINSLLHEVSPSPRAFSAGFQRVLLVVGGQPNQNQGSVEYYDLESATWRNLSNTRLNLVTATILTVNQKIYVVGESSINNTSYGTFGEYDLSTDSWYNCVAKESKCMKTSSRNVTLLNNCIYSVGDPSNLGSSNAAEKFDLRTRKRTLIAPMSTARSYAALGVLDHLLYVVGGHNYFCGTLETAECYNPRTNTWRNLPNIKSPRQDAGICALNGSLYVIGGCDGRQYLNSVLVFDPKIQRWEEIAAMTVNRYRPGVVAYNNSVYVIGGDMTSNNAKYTIEVYDTEKKTWSTLSQMRSGRSGHGVALVYKPK